jgi:hypothetical protein
MRASILSAAGGLRSSLVTAVYCTYASPLGISRALHLGIFEFGPGLSGLGGLQAARQGNHGVCAGEKHIYPRSVLLRVPWQVNGEQAAFAQPAFNGDVAAVGLGDVFDDGQA